MSRGEPGTDVHKQWAFEWFRKGVESSKGSVDIDIRETFDQIWESGSE